MVLVLFPLWAVLVGVVWLFREYPVEITAAAILVAGTLILKRWVDERAANNNEADSVTFRIFKDGTVLGTFDGQLGEPDSDAFRELVSHIALIMNEKAEREQTDGENKN